MVLLYSIFALLLGPFLYAWGRHLPNAKQILDGFVLIAIAGIVCVNIIPDSIAVGGYYAFLFLAAGLFFPIAVEKTFRHSIHRAHVFIVILAALGLILHAIIDGIALLPDVFESTNAAMQRTNTMLAESMFDNQLALGVILHRLPVGMAIWWSVRPGFGVTAALSTFVLIIAATTLAYFFGAPIVEWAETRSIGYFQAFVAGSLVHVVAFGVSHDHDERPEAGNIGNSWGYRVGILLGLFVMFAVPGIH